ncbi:MAG: argininosuccinate lyase [Ignavibacteriae bacterium]|nr:argininosuccinate lyase [Ignavibacteriota bacterium]
MKVWNGRFKKPLHPEALKFSSSLPVDKRLFEEDIEGSLAHVAMLAKQKIIAKADAAKIQKALKEIRIEIRSGKLSFGKELNGKNRFVAEDIHMAIEQRLLEKVGDLGGKLHTARSRNDQIALDERLYLHKVIVHIKREIRQLQKTFLRKAEQYQQVVMPGYTHLQHAQPILLVHHLLAYVSMFERDGERFDDCLKRVNRSPLGAGALAGTSFPIDRAFLADSLGMIGIIDNSIDAVSDRDVHIEFLSACAITMMHLSRFAEEMILWTSREWNFAEIGDEFTTGSSIMPQKKNPDMAELVRGKTGRVYGNLVALLTVMKGLPLAYNRDMQEDKEPLFDSADTLSDCLKISSAMLKTVTFNKERFELELQADFTLATELADYLVRKGLPFRKAHAVVGAIVQKCLKEHKTLNQLSLKEYQTFSKEFKKDVYQILEPETSLQLKKSFGSTSPKEVRRAIERWKKKFNHG